MLLLFWIALYFIPAVLAAAMQKKALGSILVVNFLLGWTVVGWIWAFMWAITGERKPAVVYLADRGSDEGLLMARVNAVAPQPARFVMHCDSCRHEWVAERKATTCDACYSTYVKAI